MLKVAVTGYIASGKSTVLKIFEELGVPVIDTDGLVRDLLDNDYEVLSKIKKFFPKCFIDGEFLDKQLLTNQVFNNKKDLDLLESIIHPIVFENINDFVSQFKDKTPYILIEMPVLFQNNYVNLFDKIIWIESDPVVTKQRFDKRDMHHNPANFELIMNTQKFDESLLKNPKVIVITNALNLEELKDKILKIHKEIISHS